MSALAFRAEVSRTASRLCTYPGHDTAYASSGCYRVAIAGHPLLGAHGEIVYCCERCRRAITRLWTDAGGADPASSPASGAQEAL